MRVSVIIPLSPIETELPSLLQNLVALPKDCEIILALPQGAEPVINMTESKLNIRSHIEGSGRAAQMNAAARHALGDQLWFLHADTRLDHTAITALFRRLDQFPDWLLYADLAFINDATPLMRLNEIGVWFRSHVMGMPFGDQGLCIKKRLFFEIGGYPENVAYGEDHVFVWRARQHGIKLRPINARIYTSARKYLQRGWLKTTGLHLWLTWRQAWPEWYRLIAGTKKP